MDANYSSLEAHYSSKSDEYYEQSRPEMLPFVPDSCSSILEVGCSSGAFGALLKKERPGVEIWGIEPDVRSAQQASDRLDHVIAGTFSEALPKLEGRHFDAICFFDVLEHVADPENVLVQCKQLLSDNGVVVASIPNILHFYQITKILIEQDWRYEDAGILDATHLRFFTKKSILRMFADCGFEVGKIEGIYPSYGAKYRIVNFLTLGRLRDWKYVQFAVQAAPTKKK